MNDEGSRTITLFVSSPGDVLPERDAVTRVVDRLNDQQRGLLKIRTIRWENAYYGAHDTFQAQIIETEACDLLVCIFWRRLGSELPPDFPKRMKDGRPFPSGTVYELVTALDARAQKKTPDVWVYKKTQMIADAIQDPAEMALRLRQWQALEDFWKEFFINAHGQFTAAYKPFETVEQFEAVLEKNLRDWLNDKGLLSTRPEWSLLEKGSPFRGLEPFDVEHEQIMFGREQLATRAVDAIRCGVIDRRPFLLLIGESGSGKSSLARGAIIPRVMRQTGEAPGHSDVWRLACVRIEAGESPFRLLAETLFEPGALPELTASDFATPDALTAMMREGGASAAAPVAKALGRIGERFRSQHKLERPGVARLLLLLDQLESLFASSSAEQNAFASLLQSLVGAGLVVVIGTLRSDRYDAFCRVDGLLSLKTSGAALDIPMPGLSEIADIVRKPALAAGISYEVDRRTGQRLDEILISAAAGRDALPLLQFTLQKLYEGMLGRLSAQGTGLANATADQLTLSPEDYDSLGGLEGAIGLVAESAYRKLDGKSQANLAPLVRALVRGSGRNVISEPALEKDLVSNEHMARLIEALLDCRILISGVRTLDDGENARTFRFAHEAVIRGWPAVRESVAANESFYRIRDEIDFGERRWRESGRSNDRLIALGQPLAEARTLLRDFRSELPESLVAYVEASIARERAFRRGSRRFGALVASLGLVAVAATAYVAVSKRDDLRAYLDEALDKARPETLTADRIAKLRKGNTFQECRNCPLMMVVPAGSFMMGASTTEPQGVDAEGFKETIASDPTAYSDESPVHKVTIGASFAISEFDVTFAEWDECYFLGGCSKYPSAQSWGRDQRPVINVDWDDAEQYVRWLARISGAPYRLPSEAEWEYSARAQTATPFYWGDQTGKNQANCDRCGSRWDNQETAPVGSFKPNPFGLYDMAGEVWQWVEDCYAPTYQGAPSDGSPRLAPACTEHVVRGGSWYNHPINIRSAMRYWHRPGPQPLDPVADTPADSIGFRVLRTLP